MSPGSEHNNSGKQEEKPSVSNARFISNKINEDSWTKDSLGCVFQTSSSVHSSQFLMPKLKKRTTKVGSIIILMHNSS